MIEVELPDGTIAEFPDGTANDVIKGALQKRFAQPAAQSPEMTQGLSELSAITQNPAKAQYDQLPGWQKPIVAASDMLQLGANGATMGFGDKAVAAVRAPFTDKTYGEELAAQRGLTQGARNRSGGAGTVAEVGGAIATPLAAAGKGLTLAGRAGTAGMQGIMGLGARTGLMAAEGAGYGALTAAGNDQSIGEGAAIGALGGAAGNVIGEGLSAGVGKIAGAFNKKPYVPTNDELRSAANAAYQQADNAGVVYAPTGIQRISSDIKSELADFGYDPALQPRIGVVLNRLDELSQGNVTLKGMDVLRRVANNARTSMDASERKIGGKVIEMLDDFVENPKANEVVMGNQASGSAALKDARQLWRRLSKSEMVDTAAIKAERRAASTGSGGNVENATRQNIRAIMDSPSKSRGMSKDELAAMDKVVRGTPVQNALRLGGKLSPQGNGLMAALGIGGTLANPMVALPMMAGGALSKIGAEKMTMKSMEELSRALRAGGSPTKAAPNALQRLAQSKRPEIARILMALGISQAVPQYEK